MEYAPAQRTDQTKVQPIEEGPVFVLSQRHFTRHIYIDDCILIAKTNKLIKEAIREISDNFEITDEGEVDEYLGVKVERLKDNRIK